MKNQINILFIKNSLNFCSPIEILLVYLNITNKNKNMKELLIKLEACKEVIEWAGDKSWEEIYNTCHRGDWLLWLHNRTNKEDLQIRTLAKGHCANTVRHLMKDERSIKAIDTAIAFGEGKATIQDLNDAAHAAIYATNSVAYYAAIAAYYTAADADAAANAAHSYAAAAAAIAAYTAAATDAYAAANAADAYAAANAADAYAAAVAAADAAADAAYYTAKSNNQKETADIVRKYIPIELWNVQKMIDELKLEKEATNE